MTDTERSMADDERRRAVQAATVRHLLLRLRADVDRQLTALAEGLIVPDELRDLRITAARIAVDAEPLWAGIDLNGPVTYELGPDTPTGDTPEEKPC